MRHQTHILFLLLAAAALLSSCTKGLKPPMLSDAASLEVASTTLPAEAGNAFVSVRTDGPWVLEIADGAGWASVSPATGMGPKNNVVLSYESNTGVAPRKLRL